MLCKYCGGDRFVGHMVERHDCVVDGDGNHEQDLECYDSGTPYGPFTCLGCGASYEDLDSPKVVELPKFEAVSSLVDSILKVFDGLMAQGGNIFQMCMDVVFPLVESGVDKKDALRIAMAIDRAWLQMDEDSAAEYSVSDIVDAITNLPPDIKFQTVLDATYLSVDRFNNFIITMAAQKRAVYCSDWLHADELREVLAEIQEAIQAPADQKTVQAEKAKGMDFPFRNP